MVVDTTGAGDAFCGTLIYFLVEIPEIGMVEAIKRSCDVTSLSVQKEGTQSSYPFRREVPEWLFSLLK